MSLDKSPDEIIKPILDIMSELDDPVMKSLLSYITLIKKEKNEKTTRISELEEEIEYLKSKRTRESDSYDDRNVKSKYDDEKDKEEDEKEDEEDDDDKEEYKDEEDDEDDKLEDKSEDKLKTKKEIKKREELEIKNMINMNSVCKFCFGDHKFPSCFLFKLIQKDREEEIMTFKHVAISKGINFKLIFLCVIDYLRNYIPLYPLEFNKRVISELEIYHSETYPTLEKDYPELFKKSQEVSYIEESNYTDLLIENIKNFKSEKKSLNLCRMCESPGHTYMNCKISNFVKINFERELRSEEKKLRRIYSSECRTAIHHHYVSFIRRKYNIHLKSIMEEFKGKEEKINFNLISKLPHTKLL